MRDLWPTITRSAVNSSGPTSPRHTRPLLGTTAIPSGISGEHTARHTTLRTPAPRRHSPTGHTTLRNTPRLRKPTTHRLRTTTRGTTVHRLSAVRTGVAPHRLPATPTTAGNAT
ncbi:hypothetical protein LV78_007777 [Actinosynnema pretiosum]|nr:hypothetical protein [Actinosynnema pretiosum]